MKATELPVWHTATLGLGNALSLEDLEPFLEDGSTCGYFEDHRTPLISEGPRRRLDLVLLSEEDLGLSESDLAGLIDDEDPIEGLIRKGLALGLQHVPQEVIIDLVAQPPGALRFADGIMLLAGESITEVSYENHVIELCKGQDNRPVFLLMEQSKTARIAAVMGISLIFARETPQ